MDRQEAKLRAELERTGVSVTRIGDNITLNMPGNITFATNSADLNASFFEVLNSVSIVLDEFDQTVIEIAGHTDSTGTDCLQPAAVRAPGELRSRRTCGTRSVLARSHHHGRHGRGPAGRDERHRCRAPAEPPCRAHARAADARDLRPSAERRRAHRRHGAPFFFVDPSGRLGRGELLLELRDRVRLDLADALRRDAILRGQLVQRGLVVG